ncbi:hypothetical protein ACRQ5D_09835 [Mucilaginibacter sp. P25]|uniref:hypothetical protein n=1 Tax=unclassified Mucilaginibacter TaxID=2617802 RepID=UPI003D667C9D
MNLKPIFYQILLSVICIQLFAAFRPDQHKSIHSQATENGSKATILFRLKAHEQFRLEYMNAFLEAKQLKFINPGEKDTVIIRNVTTNIPVALTMTFFEFGKDKSTKERKFSVLASPGDTLNLSLTSQGFLNTERLKKELYYPTILFHIIPTILLRPAAKQYPPRMNFGNLFIQNLIENFEKKRIGSMAFWLIFK